MGYLCVDHDLSAMPRFDCGKKPRLPQMANGNVARPRFRPRRGIALRDLLARPFTRLACGEQMDSGEAGGEDVVAPVAVPVGHEDAVDDALILGADHMTLPFPGNVV